VIGAGSSGIATLKALFRRVFKPGLERGEYHLPSRAAMQRDIGRESERLRRRYVASKRHTMEVDFEDYLFRLRRELKAGAGRAQAAGYRLPVPARASTAALRSEA
jgi:dimethylaniline monooxygenase (N-oxide forming)